MPLIIDYSVVLETLSRQGLVCRYPASGAFGFAPPVAPLIRGWIGPADPTIRPEMAERTRSILAPYEQNLAASVEEFVQRRAIDRTWAMPMSHWAYEMEYGGQGWLADLLQSVALFPGDFAGRNNGSAIEFSLSESRRLRTFVEGLLRNLGNSDFMLAFPGRPLLCMVHHHKQLWWMSFDASLLPE